MTVTFYDRVAIVTGAGGGLGKSHALELARRGAKVIVNDPGGALDGTGVSGKGAQDVVTEIEAMGGEAMAHGANVASFHEVEDMVEQVMERWGRIDILINNAGILRDKTFSKMDLNDFKCVLDVHLMGSVNCTKAVWEIMREQRYGRIVMTTSSSGMYGNFGQSNYSAAKMAVLGFMNTIGLEGAKYDIRVNALSPTAGTRMTEDLMPPEYLDALTPESVTAGALTLCHEDAPSRFILCAGAGCYASTRLFETEGIYLLPSEQTPEAVLNRWGDICDTSKQAQLETGGKQTEKFLTEAMRALQGQAGNQSN